MQLFRLKLSFLCLAFLFVATQSQDQVANLNALVIRCKLESTENVPALGSSVCAKLSFVSRSEWEGGWANSYDDSQDLQRPVQYVIVHDIPRETPACRTRLQCLKTMRSVWKYDTNELTKSDIRYNWVIGGDGRVYEGKGWGYRAEHVGKNMDPKSLSVGILGSHDNDLLPEKTECIALNLVACGVSRGIISRNYTIHGHTDVACTSCPGNMLKQQLKSWPRYRAKLDNVNDYTCE